MTRIKSLMSNSIIVLTEEEIVTICAGYLSSLGVQTGDCFLSYSTTDNVKLPSNLKCEFTTKVASMSENAEEAIRTAERDRRRCLTTSRMSKCKQPKRKVSVGSSVAASR